MLFPLFRDGTLADALAQARLHAICPSLFPLLRVRSHAARPISFFLLHHLSSPIPIAPCSLRLASRQVPPGARRFQPLEVLHIVRQVAAALSALHSAVPPHAHRDVKPQNVLLRHPRRRRPPGEAPADSEAPAEAPPAASAGLSSDPPGEASASASASASSQQVAVAAAAAGGGAPPPPEASGSGRIFSALIDLGSVRPARVRVTTRRQAMEVRMGSLSRRAALPATRALPPSRAERLPRSERASVNVTPPRLRTLSPALACHCA